MAPNLPPRRRVRIVAEEGSDTHTDNLPGTMNEPTTVPSITNMTQAENDANSSPDAALTQHPNYIQDGSPEATGSSSNSYTQKPPFPGPSTPRINIVDHNMPSSPTVAAYLEKNSERINVATVDAAADALVEAAEKEKVKETTTSRIPRHIRTGFKALIEIAKPGQVATQDGDDLEARQRHLGQFFSEGFHDIPWNEREIVPPSAAALDTCSCCAVPVFWERVDWAFRTTFLCVLPTALLAILPGNQRKFGLQGLPIVLALWVSQPTLGAGIHELLKLIRATTISIGILMLCVYIDPKIVWTYLAIFVVAVFFVALISQDMKRPCSFITTSALTYFYLSSEDHGYEHMANFFADLLIGVAIGCSSFFLPWVNWALASAEGATSMLGGTTAVSIQGICRSFWADSLDRELNLVRLRQLRHGALRYLPVIDEKLSESEYEPLRFSRKQCVRYRRDLFATLMEIVNSTTGVIEIACKNPRIMEQPVIKALGEQISEPLLALAGSMDSYISKLRDFEKKATSADKLVFEENKNQFDKAIHDAIQKCILDNTNFCPGPADIIFGSFLFSIEQLCETLLAAEDPVLPQSWTELFLQKLSDLSFPFKQVFNLFKSILVHWRIPRRAKEAVKMTLSMGISTLVEIWLNIMDPLSGSTLIAWVYDDRGAGTFQNLINRVLGMVFGSVISYMVIRFAEGVMPVMFVVLTILTLIGGYVQALKGSYSAGNAFIWGVVGVVVAFEDVTKAGDRFTANSFAVFIYFVVSSVLWPVRVHNRIREHLAGSMHAFREAALLIIREVGAYRPENVIVDAQIELGEMSKNILQQEGLVDAAVSEPTLMGIDYPEEQWRRIIGLQSNLLNCLRYLRFAFCTFTSRVVPMQNTGALAAAIEDGDSGFVHQPDFDNNSPLEENDNDFHWRLMGVLSEPAKRIAALLFTAVDLYLLMNEHGSAKVPAQALIKVRLNIVEEQAKLEMLFVNCIKELIMEGASPTSPGVKNDHDNFKFPKKNSQTVTGFTTAGLRSAEAVAAETSAEAHSLGATIRRPDLNTSNLNSMYSFRIIDPNTSEVLLSRTEGMGSGHSTKDRSPVEPKETKKVDKKEQERSSKTPSQSPARGTLSTLDASNSSDASGPSINQHVVDVLPQRQGGLSFANNTFRGNNTMSLRPSLLQSFRADAQRSMRSNLSMASRGTDAASVQKLQRQKDRKRAAMAHRVLRGVVDSDSDDGGGEQKSLLKERERRHLQTINTSKSPNLSPARDGSEIPENNRLAAQTAVPVGPALQPTIPPTEFTIQDTEAMQNVITGMQNRRRALREKALSSIMNQLTPEQNQNTGELFVALREAAAQLDEVAPSAPTNDNNNALRSGERNAVVEFNLRNFMDSKAGTQMTGSLTDQGIQKDQNVVVLEKNQIKRLIKAIVFTSGDIASIEAFVFGIRALVSELGEFEKTLLEIFHIDTINRKM